MTAQAAPASSDSSISSTPTGSAPTPTSPTSPASSPASGSGFDKITNETSSDPDVGFSQLGEDFDTGLDDVVVPFSPTKPQANPAPAAPAAPAATQPVAQPAPPAQVQPEVPQQPAAAAPAAAPADAPAAATDVPPVTVDALLQAMNERSAEVLQQVVPEFALSPEQITELETDAATAVPKLLAQTHLRSLKAMATLLKEMVPSMIVQTVEQQNAARDMEASFFKQWDKLDRNKHGADIKSFAHAFAAANPKMTREELFSLVGAAVMAKHGLTMNAPAASAAPPPPVVPFAPAATSAPVVHQKPVDDSNPFAGMGRNFDEE